AYGWCRTCWSCATLAATLKGKHGVEVSAETGRRWLHERGWMWKRAKLVAKDDVLSGWSAWPGCDGMPNRGKRMKCWSLLMNLISISCPRSARLGCPKGTRWKS